MNKIDVNGEVWWVLEGDDIPLVVRLVTKHKHYNKPCSCGSGKKFKKCCGRM